MFILPKLVPCIQGIIALLFLQKTNATKPFKFSSIGNWIQCQEVLEGDGDGNDETICGKWRR